MMAQNPVAAREGGMKDYEDCIYHLSPLSSIRHLLFALALALIPFI